jgi:hypothetical protein
MAAGSPTSIFGRITSKFYQGTWRHDVDIDGNPVVNFGKPYNQFSGSRIIIRGSSEENLYYAELKRKEKEELQEKKREAAELRKNIANAYKILVGTWRTEKAVAIYNSDGTFHAKLDDGQESLGTWSVENDVVSFQFKEWKYKNGKWAKNDGVNKSKIIYIDQNQTTYKALQSGNKYTETRIK